MYFKSHADKEIKMTLFGVGEVQIPAKAACIELDKVVADAINAMAFPHVILEEVTPKITVETSPVVKAPAKRTTSK